MGGTMPWNTNNKVNLQREQGFAREPAEKAPPLTDPTDEALRKRRALALTKASLGTGRKSTMLTGQLGEATLGKTLLGGY